MTTYVYRDGKLVDKRFAKPLHGTDQAVYVISDTMDAMQHMASGKWHTSKAAFRKDTRAHNCVEYGNETSTLLKPRPHIQLSREKRRDDIRRTIYELRNGRG